MTGERRGTREHAEQSDVGTSPNVVDRTLLQRQTFKQQTEKQ